MYDPHKLKKAYDKLEHGKARVSAIRSAAEDADTHQDTPFRIFFRLDLCRESCFYGDSLDMMIVFPEALAMIDRYPDTPATAFNNNFRDSMAHILWVYKWVLNTCGGFYQIPMSDCLKFLEDFKKRSLAYGYGLRTYYDHVYNFYYVIDEQKAEAAFHQFENTARDANSDCKACERNEIIDFYLRHNDLDRANRLSAEIENLSLRCHGARMRAWLVLKKNYMHYYLRQHAFEEAEAYCRLIDPRRIKNEEFCCWDDFLYCYAYRDMGKALQIYRSHWKEWEQERKPSTIFDICLNCFSFFNRLATAGKKQTVKLSMDQTFCLYEESGVYRTERLYSYYYNKAKDLAQKFDKRNGSDFYMECLREWVGFLES